MLTLQDLETLLARLAPDREQAGSLYEDIRRKLVRLFAPRLGPDSESLADEAIDRVARRLAQDPAIHLKRPFAYFWSVAGYVAQEMLRERKREHQAHDAFADLYRRSTGLRESVDFYPGFWLEKCLAELPADRQRLILGYYGKGDRISGRRRLAQELGIDLNALRIRALRARRELRACCFRCTTLSRARGVATASTTRAEHGFRCRDGGHHRR